MRRLPVGILGATGVVGQNFLSLLADHPWFEVTFVAGSARTAGKTIGEVLPTVPPGLTDLHVHPVEAIDEAKKSCRLVFSAVGSDVARQFEEAYAAAGLGVVSNASCHRETPDVPVIIPEVNPDHLDWISQQQKQRGWKKGFLVVKPNCTIQSFVMPLAPLHRAFKAVQLSVTTLQAVSGAGYPGVPAMDILDVINPYIEGEEEKVQKEPLKILDSDDLLISAQCNRIPVRDGHFGLISVKFAQKPKREEMIALWENFQPLPQILQLPSAPERPLIYFEAGPETHWDLMQGRGMSVTVGHLQPCPHLDYRFVGLAHNTIRGAAGGAILTAELLYKQNYLC